MAIHKYGPSRVATFYIGLSRGTEPRNRTARCEAMPREFSPEEADRVFLALRAEQVGSHVGATRLVAKGWFESKPESSLVYQIAHVPNEREPDASHFIANMEALAEQLAHELCQDQVLLILDDSSHREAFGAEWASPYVTRASARGRRSPPAVHRVSVR